MPCVDRCETVGMWDCMDRTVFGLNADILGDGIKSVVPEMVRSLQAFEDKELP
jgi:hypothetical protein